MGYVIFIFLILFLLASPVDFFTFIGTVIVLVLIVYLIDKEKNELDRIRRTREKGKINCNNSEFGKKDNEVEKKLPQQREDYIDGDFVLDNKHELYQQFLFILKQVATSKQCVEMYTYKDHEQSSVFSTVEESTIVEQVPSDDMSDNTDRKLLYIRLVNTIRSLVPKNITAEEQQTYVKFKDRNITVIESQIGDSRYFYQSERINYKDKKTESKQEHKSEINNSKDFFLENTMEKKHKEKPFSIDTVIEVMRNVSNASINDYYSDPYGTKTFIEQAKYLEDVNDNYDGFEEYNDYEPHYMKMNDAQLRTYLTWRSSYKKGKITTTCESYIYVYIFEIINNVGVKNKFDAIEKLIGLWKDYSDMQEKSNRFKYSMKRWVLDYYICNSFDASFQSLIEKYGVKEYYPQYYTNENEMNYFNYYAPLATYKIRKSIFYDVSKEQCFAECFYTIINNMYTYYKSKKLDFSLVSEGSRNDRQWWTPFVHCFYQPTYGDRKYMKVTISKNEFYEYRNGSWRCSTINEYTNINREVLGYILKRMEANIRRIEGFKYKLSPDKVKMINSVSYQIGNNIEEKMKILKDDQFDVIIDSSVDKYLAPQRNPEKVLTIEENQKKKIVIDFSKLSKIREDASITQEKLIVEEDSINQDKIIVEDTGNYEDDKNYCLEEISNQDNHSAVLKKDKFTMNELKIIRAILSDNVDSIRQIEKIAKETGTLPQIIIEEINEKSLDLIGDNLVDSENDPICIYDEYIDMCKDLVSGGIV